ncbi:unnamed protein product, partial [Meganyctiphanes norvegica]
MSRPNDRALDYHYEYDRLQTFTNWPLDFIRAEDLAADGFIYVGIDDQAACVFGGHVLAGWEEGDIPNEEHKKHGPDCPFVSGQDVGNVRLVDEDLFRAALGGNLVGAIRALAASANIDMKHKVGWASIHAAAQNGHLSIVRTLLNRGANINARDFQG